MKLIKTTTMATLFSGLLLCITASANNEQGKVTPEEAKCAVAAVTANSIDRVNEAIEVCLKPAEAGSLKAQEALVNLYLDINLKEAVKWTRKAVDNGSVQAQRALGAFYLYGAGVKEDRQQAKKWLTKACNNNEQGACDLLKKYNLN
ncbi:tetratricopeptide repeat protein [Aggregatibacter segnis]|uniref:tetratricopeptide repeat protein n=1 Tax=Aggregatibacter segnis TaxID=739 RepID=UPI000D695AA1|nr:SEL1-like repeat protein [Aggregatibacter segnis]